MSNDPKLTEWDDDRIGVPVAGVKTAPVVRPLLEPVVWPDDPELRPGETDLGRPPQVARDLAPLSDDDRRRLREAEEAQAARDLAEAEELLASEPGVLRWAGLFASPLAAAFLVGSAGALGLFLYSQALGILSNLAGQPDWVKLPGYAGLAVLTGFVLFAVLRLLGLYVRLQRNRQIRVAGLNELAKRTRLRWLAHAKSADARSQVEQYLRAYPLDSDRDRKHLARVGLPADVLADLRRVRDDLLDPSRFASTTQWFERFRDGFQSRLDEAAEARIKHWARRTGVVTAFAPNGFIDGVATTYFGFTLVSDLCRVYNLRAGRTGTAVLLGRIFFNSYLAGQTTGLEKLTEEHLDHLMGPNGPLYELAAAKALSKAGGKAAGGLLNYFLLARLGKYACRLLRPVSKD